MIYFYFLEVIRSCFIRDYFIFVSIDEILFFSFFELIDSWDVRRINKDVLGEGYIDMKLRENVLEGFSFKFFNK